ncbi:MAG: tRNA (adenosine(37)-N6)-dimethylallyltransferase MiaA [Saprospiraceae bacterium]|nr:tRNA (adenosine(37)-N6)-dimethylallyltransferase MiaA [Saprospiraceae bacterium]
MKKHYLVVIGGCTGVGKTGLAVQLARHWQTAVISADSRQIYRELRIGVARPSPETLATVPHHQIADHSIEAPYDVAHYEKEVLVLLDRLFQSNPVVILVGGTGFYLRAILEGLDPLPANDPAILAQIQSTLEKEGLAALQEEVLKRDPTVAGQMDLQNARRVVRALCVMRQTGQPISELWKGKAVDRDFVAIPLLLDLPREDLYHRIDQRVDAMMQEGLLDEVRSLLPYRGLPALETVGYQELFDHLEGKTGLVEAVELVKTHTRQYAKRQVTWFKKYFPAERFSPEDVKAILNYITDQMETYEREHLAS